MAEEGKSGKRVVVVMLALAVGASLIAWFGASMLEKRSGPSAGAAAALSDGILYEAQEGEPALLIAKEVGSGKELWRAELGNLASRPTVTVNEAVIEVQIAGTPWMSFDRETGNPLE